MAEGEETMVDVCSENTDARSSEFSVSLLQSMPLVSVAITSYSASRMRDLEELLTSLTKQSYTNFEIVVVIEKSKELGAAIDRFVTENKITRARVVFSQRQLGQSQARNVAVEHCTGGIVAFIDDDAIPATDWIECIVEKMNDDSVIALTGATFPLWETLGAEWFPKEFYWIVSCTEFTGWKSSREVSHLWGVNMAFRREAFALARFKHGHEATERGKSGIEGDDVGFGIELALKSLKRVLFEPSVKVYHKVKSGRLSLGYIRRKSFWLGFTRRAFRNTYRPVVGDDLDHDSIVMIAQFAIRSLLSLWRNPITTWKRLSLASFVLLFVGLGYITEGGKPLGIGELPSGSVGVK